MRMAENVRSLRTATWLGWQMESNWTDLYLFAIYSVVKPIATSLILVLMYLVITGGQTKTDLFAFMYVGNAFYMLVGQVLFGIVWAVQSDREHFEMLKYIYLSPVQIYVYLLGRGMAKLLTTSMAVVITLAFGVAFLGIPLSLTTINYPYLAVALLLGLLGIVCLGIILAGVALVTARHNWVLSESVAGAFYVACGAVFPLDVLPGWAQVIGKLLPPTYWLEAVRRATLGTSLALSEGNVISPTMSVFSDGQLLLVLLATTLGLAALSHWFFRRMEARARRLGLIDQKTQY